MLQVYLGAVSRDGGFSIVQCVLWLLCHSFCVLATNFLAHPSKPTKTRLSRATKGRYACQCQPIQTKNAVSHSRWSITHFLAIRLTVPFPQNLSESLRSLFCHASQLSQTFSRLHFAWDQQDAP